MKNSYLTETIFNSLNTTENIEYVKDKYFSGENWVGQFTKWLYKTMIQTAKNMDDNISVACNFIREENIAADESEFLFDMLWTKENFDIDAQKNNYVLETILVMESEISKCTFGGFKEDFIKLFFTPSQCDRIFFCFKKDEIEFNRFLEYAKTSVSMYRNFQIGEGIDIIYWDETSDMKDFHLLKIRKNSQV